MITRNGRFLAGLAGIAAAIVMPTAAAFADGSEIDSGPVDTVTKANANDVKPLPKPVPKLDCEPIPGAFFSIPIGTRCS